MEKNGGGVADPVTGFQQLSLDEGPFCGEFAIIRALATSSTDKYFLRTCSEPKIIEISLAEHVKPSPYHGKE